METIKIIRLRLYLLDLFNSEIQALILIEKKVEALEKLN